MEDQAKAIDLLAAFHIDLPQAIHNDISQILSPQQRADQCSDRGQRGAHLMGDRFQQIQISMAGRFRWALSLDGLQHQPGGCAGEPLRETGPELF